MLTDSQALTNLNLYHQHGDADAFRTLVHAYQRMVFATCLRVLRDVTDAEDAVQETFATFARNAGAIRTNPAAWLYTCAMNTARKRFTAKGTRLDREREWSEMQTLAGGQDWKQLVPLIDECIMELSENDRELLVQYYLTGNTQQQLAEDLNVTRQAVTKRLQRVVVALRKKRHGRGFIVPAAVLTACLTEATAKAAVPPALTASLVKIGLAGVGNAGSAVTAVGAGAGIIGGVLGTLGGFLRTYCSIKNTNGPRERRFMVREAVVCWIAVIVLLLLLFLLPRPYNFCVWIPYGILLPLAIVRGNRAQQRIRREEADENKKQDARP